MADTKVIMPQMGESVFEGTITRWLKKPGDHVERDEDLFEISTDKVDSVIPAPASGTLQEILFGEGQTVEINTVVAVIGEGAPAGKRAAGGPPVAAESVESKMPASAPAPPKESEAGEEGPAGGEPQWGSPLVRRIAKDHGIDLAELAGKGTGAGGRVTKSDILSYIEQTKAAREKTTAAGPGAADLERVPLTAMRKSIAEHMVLSRRTSAHVTTFFEVDCARITAARERQKAEFERSGARLTITPFFIHAAARALKRFPIVNASLDGDTIVYKRSINIGIAVNLEWGLIVPVLRKADTLSLLDLTRAIQDLGERARTKKLTPDDVRDGTFTITNPGQYGALAGTPIINQPQVAIMGMGGVKKRAVVIDDAIAIRPMIVLSLSFDHRIIDGATADQFMADIQRQLESWE
ncbi:MAG TPA: dihydrolipoamide acetyltransferase family protein [Terriglobia bacterium]|nr:dihydrolipoamide acetyltransferase family protein [Terriglobia bacterium]